MRKIWAALTVVLGILAGCGEGMTKQESWIQSAKEELSTVLRVPVGEIEVAEFEEVVFSDSSFGCPEPGMMYAQATQEGYRLVLEAGGESYAYHGGRDQAPILCKPSGLENGSFTADLEGFPIHYEVHGQGPVMMVVPNSWGLDVAGLRGMLEGLEKRLTMVYFDPRGMGGSGPVREESDMTMAAVRQDFEALRAHLGLDKVHAIGWSNGAGNLILLAAESPESLESATFVHGVAKFDQEDAAEFAQRFPGLMEANRAFMQEMADSSLTDEERTARLKELWLNEFFPLSLADRESGQALLDEAFGPAEFSWAHGQVANQESASGFDMRDQLALIPVRSLVIAGAYDMSSPEKVKVLADGLPDSVYVLFDNSGHFAPLEEPEAFEALVFDFVDAP
jgi:proline iminopeptidase